MLVLFRSGWPWGGPGFALLSSCIACIEVCEICNCALSWNIQMLDMDVEDTVAEKRG